MSRGYCYEISTNPDLYPIGCLAPSDVYESRPYGVSTALDTTDPEGLVLDLLERWKAHGATIKPSVLSEDDEWGRGKLFIVTFPGDFRHSYFANDFENLRKMVQNLTLEEFATSTSKLGAIQTAIEDESDLVCLDGSFDTLDHFLRDVRPDTVYYVAASSALIID